MSVGRWRVIHGHGGFCIYERADGTRVHPGGLVKGPSGRFSTNSVAGPDPLWRDCLRREPGTGKRGRRLIRALLLYTNRRWPLERGR